MNAWLDQLAVILVALLVAVSLPLLILAYYGLRLRLRRSMLSAKIVQLHLEAEYLKVYHFADWEKIRDQDAETIRKRFEAVFAKQFRGNNGFRSFLLPLGLTTVTSVLMAVVVYRTLNAPSSVTEFFQDCVVPLSLAGAMLYVFPSFTARYAALSLDPQSLLSLLGRLWLAVITGVVVASAVTTALQPIAAFLGSLLPVAGLDFLAKKVFTPSEEKGAAERAAAEAALLEVLHQDRELLAQLNHIGIRSVLQLAYENPLKIFVESDLNLIACIDLVDQANLHLYVPDREIRKELNRFGVRTAVDIMTQLDEYFPTASGGLEYRTLRPDEALPDRLKGTLSKMAAAMKLDTVETLVNLIRMMQDNPQLQYTHGFWDALDEKVDLTQPRVRRAPETFIGQPVPSTPHG